VAVQPVENLPHVAAKKPRKSATRGNLATVHDLAAERAKRHNPQQPESATRGSISKPKAATRGRKLVARKSATCGAWQVDFVRASENTYAFRLRWAQGEKRETPLYVSRVSITTFKLIREGNYDAFKIQLISEYGQGAILSSQTAG
ncbi:MAG: hypothetical protein ACRD82_05310, partial [Blastocatellia bacterium]